MSSSPVVQSFKSALDDAEAFSAPYRHWFLKDILPKATHSELCALEFPTQELDGVSGKRELHNDTRHYFDQNNISKHQVIADIADAFQSEETTRTISEFFDIDLSSTYLRIEYAQDTDGFWLQPHTDLGVKRLTVLIYLSDGEGHANLGTDIYDAEKNWAKTSPFSPNTALAFVPGDNTYHGFEPREIKGVRKSAILNYVTSEWRDREQLAFPTEPID